MGFWAILLFTSYLCCGEEMKGVVFSTDFRVKASENYANLTQMLVGEAADGDTFRIVRREGRAGKDTAWRVTSESVAVPPDAAFVVFEFDFYGDDEHWRAGSSGASVWSNRFKWTASDGREVHGLPWVDTLGLRHDAESFALKCAPKTLSRFRFVREVPEGAATLQIALGCDSPNVNAGERVSVRGATISFLAKGQAKPREIVPDMTGPNIVRLFASPTEDAHVKAQFRVMDASAIDWASLAVTRVGSKERVSFVRTDDVVTLMPDATWAAGDHHFQFSVADAVGNRTEMAKAFRIGRKPDVPGTKLRSDGVLLVDGKPMFPIGFYALCPREANLYSLDRCMADLKAAGVNLAHSYSHFRTPEFAAACAKYGMISFQREYDAGRGSKWFEATARQDPTVGLWYVGDDTSRLSTPQTVANRVDALDALDGTRLTCHADAYNGQFVDYANIVDVFMPEIYPITGSEIDCNCVGEVIKAMDGAYADIRRIASGKPHAVWPIIQYFKGWSSWKRMPTPTEVYAMSFAALIHGAKGITWYTYGGFLNPEKQKFNYGICSSATSWDTATNLTQRISSLAPVLLSGDVPQPRVPEVLKGPAQDPCKQPSVTMLLKEGDDATCILAVNATREPVRARLFFGERQATSADVLWEQRTVTVKDGAFEDDFAPFGVHVYKLR